MNRRNAVPDRNARPRAQTQRWRGEAGAAQQSNDRQLVAKDRGTGGVPQPPIAIQTVERGPVDATSVVPAHKRNASGIVLGTAVSWPGTRMTVAVTMIVVTITLVATVAVMVTVMTTLAFFSIAIIVASAMAITIAIVVRMNLAATVTVADAFVIIILIISITIAANIAILIKHLRHNPHRRLPKDKCQQYYNGAAGCTYKRRKAHTNKTNRI